MAFDPFGTLMQGVGFVGNVLDTPGSVVRGLAAGRPEDAFSGILDPSRRVRGRDVLESAGLVGPETGAWDAGDVGGFATELALDPLNWVGGGLLAGASRNAGKAKAALRDTGYFNPADYAKNLGGGGFDTPYLQARRTALEMQPHNPVLKMDMGEAGKAAQSMGRENFLYGAPKVNEPVPMKYWKYNEDYSSDLEHLLANPNEVPPNVQEAWRIYSTRYPRTAQLNPNIVEMPNYSQTDQAAGFFRDYGHNRVPEDLAMIPNEIQRKSLFGVPVGGGELSPGSMIHEGLHSAQNRLGMVDPSLYANRGAMDLALEPSAWRRSFDEEQASALYDFLNAQRPASLLAKGLAGYNALQGLT